MRPDPDHAAIQAIARTITDNAGVAPEIVAQLAMAQVLGLGYRQRIEPAQDWRHYRHGGEGMPTQDSAAARAVAAYRAETGTGRRP